VIHKRRWLLAGTLLGCMLATGADHAAEAVNYSVAELLKPCMEGDNDSRWGEVAEMECEQYVSGFADAYLMFRDPGKEPGVCLPETGNRPDEIRWAFMKWAHRHYDQRDMPAGEGLLEAIRAEFPCP